MYTIGTKEDRAPSAVQQRLGRLDSRLSAEMAASVHPFAPVEAARDDAPERPVSADRVPRPIDGWRIADWLWRGKLVVLACIIAGVLIAYLTALVLPPRYTSYTDILINPAQIQLPSGDLYAPNAQREAQLLDLDSKVRVLTSTNVLARTVSALSLETDREFVDGARSDEEAQLMALRSLYERVSARRDGQTYVATLAVWSNDPMKSVQISESLVANFRAEIATADADSSVRAAASLTERLEALRAAVNASEANVADYRRANNLQVSGGELLSSQSLSQLNTQVNEARASLISAEARHAELVAIQQSGPAGTATIDSAVLDDMRARYGELRREIDAQSAIYGPRHPTIAVLQPQLQSIAADVEAEVRRLVDNAASDVDRAQSVLSQLMSQSDTMRSAASEDNDALVRLRELEREAEVQAAVYEAYLQRTAEIVERGQIDATNVRVISPAVPAEGRSWPPRTLVLVVIGAIVGGMVGVGLIVMAGLARHYLPLWRSRPEPANAA